MIYVLIIVMLLMVYAALLLTMERMKNTKTANGIFFAVIYLLYVVYVIRVLMIAGHDSIYFYGVLATANISPFMFSILPIIYFSKGSVHKYLCILVSLLSVGMILSPTLNATTYAINGVAFQVYAVWDYIAHLGLSLWGIYFVRSGQVKITLKDSIISSLIIICVAILMIALNLIFDTAFFGLSLRGKHNIYGNVISNNSCISAIVYFVGLSTVITAGYFYSRAFRRKDLRKNI